MTAAFPLTAPHPLLYDDILRRAFAEDLGRGGDLMSIGWLTHSAPTLDVGLDL